MSLNSNALTTLDSVKSFLEINNTDYDTLLETLINGISLFIENYIGYPIKQASYTENVKGFEINQMGKQYFLKKKPVQSLTSITKEGTTLTSDDDYLFIKSQGRIIFSDSLDIDDEDDFVFTYSAGYSEVPSDLKMVCEQLVSMFFKHRDLSMTSTNTQGIAKSVDPSKLPQVVKRTLDLYRRVSLR